MSAKWTSKPIPEESKADKPTSMDEQFVVLLLYGKNSFGDKIYSYVKITLPNLPKLKTAIKMGKGFNPSDFGEVVAAGKDEPTTDIRSEVANAYQIVSNNTPNVAARKPLATEEKKAWDEF